MKTKLAILVIVAAAMVSFTVINQSKGSASEKAKTAASSQTGGSKYLSDKGQFN